MNNNDKPLSIRIKEIIETNKPINQDNVMAILRKIGVELDDDYEKQLYLQNVVKDLKWYLVTIDCNDYHAVCMVYDIIKINAKYDRNKGCYSLHGWFAENIPDLLLKINNQLTDKGLDKSVNVYGDIDDTIVRKWIDTGYYTFGSIQFNSLEEILSLPRSDKSYINDLVTHCGKIRTDQYEERDLKELQLLCRSKGIRFNVQDTEEQLIKRLRDDDDSEDEE